MREIIHITHYGLTFVLFAMLWALIKCDNTVRDIFVSFLFVRSGIAKLPRQGHLMKNGQYNGADNINQTMDCTLEWLTPISLLLILHRMSVTMLLCCCCYITCRNTVVLAACHSVSCWSPAVCGLRLSSWCDCCSPAVFPAAPSEFVKGEYFLSN